MSEEKVQLDVRKLIKGARVRLLSGRVLTVSGMYLSASGPALMLKENPSQTTAENVEIGQVLEIVEA